MESVGRSQNEEMSEQKKKFLKPNSQGWLVDNYWWVGHLQGAAKKVVKQDLKNGKDLDDICFKEVLGKDSNLFAWNVDYN